MNKSINIIYFSRILVFTYLLIGLFAHFIDSSIIAWLSLDTARIIHYFEIWRIVSFTLVPNSLESALLFAFSFWVIGALLEDRFKTFKFAALLSILTMLQGTVFSLLFWNSATPLIGGEGLALFVISLYMFFELTNKTTNFSLKSLRSLPFVLLITVVWFASVIIHETFNISYSFVAPLISGSFGILTAAFVFMQIKFALHLFRPYTSVSGGTVTKPQEQEILQSNSVMKTKPIFHSDYNEENDDIADFDSDDYYSEEKLNRILDKMNEYGKQSLTSDELLYLKEYSEYL